MPWPKGCSLTTTFRDRSCRYHQRAVASGLVYDTVHQCRARSLPEMLPKDERGSVLPRFLWPFTGYGARERSATWSCGAVAADSGRFTCLGIVSCRGGPEAKPGVSICKRCLSFMVQKGQFQGPGPSEWCPECLRQVLAMAPEPPGLRIHATASRLGDARSTAVRPTLELELDLVSSGTAVSCCARGCSSQAGLDCGRLELAKHVGLIDVHAAQAGGT